MSFADLVAADFNFRHPERVREGKPVKPEDMGDWMISLCRVMDRYRVFAPGVTSQFREEPEELEPTNVLELGIVT